MFSKTWSVLLVVSLFSDFSHGQSDKKFFRADYSYLETTKAFYKIHTVIQTWGDATQVCALEGATLFYPDNKDEADAVISFLKSTQPSIKEVYIGLSDIKSEGQFETVDGKSISEVYHQWQENEPNDSYGDEDCMHLYLSGNLNDVKCYEKTNFICKKSLLTLEMNYSSNLINSDGQRDKKKFRADYSYLETTKAFYKIHTVIQTWGDATQVCALEGATLFYPDNKDEADAVISFLKSTQPSIKEVYIGLSDIKSEGQFETIDGKSISEVYHQWQESEPNDTQGDEDCVHLYLSGNLNDVKCYEKTNFICKKSLPTLEMNYSSNRINSAMLLNGQKNLVFFRKDYTYIEAGESFYKIHTTVKNWRDAKQVCALEGASLFYPKNRDEANAVISFWILNQNNTQPDNTWVFVGISDIITEGVYETIDGKPISEIYNNWAINQPDNSDNEDCVHLDQTGDINDITCDAQYSFICKKSLPSLERNCNSNIQKFDLDKQMDKTFFRKDYTYLESEESFYKVHTTAQGFADAKRMCALEGASLFYAENEDEANAVISFWNSTQPNIPWVFVGLTDIMAEGLFETIDKRPITEVYSRWQTNQPDNYAGNEDCVRMDLLGTMNDYPCDYKSPFICKKTRQSLEWNYECNMPNLDYTFNKNTGKCYKLHTTPLNWTEAYAMCRIEYTSLAMISNRMEADYLAKLTKSTPKPCINEQYRRGIYHLGFHNRFNEGWQTVKGTPMNVVADVWFDNHQPDGNHYEDCGAMFFNGRLINTDCNKKSMFICEHEVDSSKL